MHSLSLVIQVLWLTFVGNQKRIENKMETFDWDQTITVHNDDEDQWTDQFSSSGYYKQCEEETNWGTIKFKSVSATRDSSHAANISAKERADDAEFNFQVKQKL